MRVALLADVHGNVEALTACIERAHDAGADLHAQPRDGRLAACYAMLELERRVLTLPEILAWRLEHGE